MTIGELREIIEIVGLSDSCMAFDIDRDQAESDAIELLKRLEESQESTTSPTDNRGYAGLLYP